jgi:Ca2+-binding RTX toxin-like protein
VIGGDGNDRLFGGPGNDVLSGQDGRDYLNTRDNVRGNDIANGGAGADTCDTDRGDLGTSCWSAARPAWTDAGRVILRRWEGA